MVHSLALPLNELRVLSNEVLHNQFSHYSHDILHIVVLQLSEIVSILLLGHLEAFEIVLAGVIYKT